MQIQQGQARQAAVPTTPEVHFNQTPLAAFSLTIAIVALWLAYLPAITGAV